MVDNGYASYPPKSLFDSNVGGLDLICNDRAIRERPPLFCVYILLFCELFMTVTAANSNLQPVHWLFLVVSHCVHFITCS